MFLFSWTVLQVVILRVSESDTARVEKHMLAKLSPPKPEACAKVRVTYHIVVMIIS